MNTDNKELKIFGLNMIKISLIYSVFLIIWGFAVTFMSDSESLTSFIPTVLGSVILILATLSFKMPGKQKIFMHIAVVFGLIIFIFGAELLLKIANGADLFVNYWADITRLMFLITGGVFCALCIKSFRFARQNK
tara:strand:+ start:40 stop:444 length:405 start_codon:yes stop_codon:yes gene_type:complete